MTAASADISVRTLGAAGRVTLTRPGALNALSHDMALRLEKALLAWRGDGEIQCVLLGAEGSKAFCAGGDVVELFEQGTAKDYASGIQFWRDEYRLNALMAAYPKPIAALMNGIVMGGGVGISAHCSHRIVTENTMLALPECSIGLVPDVGSSHLLAKAPGHLGEYIGLSGFRMNAADAIHCGFADYFVKSEDLPALEKTLLESVDFSSLEAFCAEPPKSTLAAAEEEISEAFGKETLEKVMVHLAESHDEWAAFALKKIGQSSPLSCKTALELIRRARARAGVQEALTREFAFVAQAMAKGDFLEGVRAAVIDKDKAPKWQHKSMQEVSAGLVETMLNLPEGGAIPPLAFLR